MTSGGTGLAWLATAITVAAGLYLVALGGLALLQPAAASRFLLAFASGARLHYLEMGLRIAVGAAFVQSAPRMAASGVFLVMGWVLVATSAALLPLPWRWHRRMAEQSVPKALRFLPLMGVASLLAGAGVLLAAFSGAG